MAIPTGQSLTIKGIRDGLLIHLGDEAYTAALANLTAELDQKQDFWRGSRVVLEVGERPLQHEQLADIQELCARRGLALWAVLADTEDTRAVARDLGLATRLPGSQTDLDGNVLPHAPAVDSVPGPPSTVGPGGMLLKETLRSGRSVYHEGHVIVIGDVNPGAEIIAGGDVIVWGRLRGLVHAGALGDRTAVICALELSPTQLRIADAIAIPPAERQRHPVPEQAFCRDGQIVAEAWQTR